VGKTESPGYVSLCLTDVFSYRCCVEINLVGNQDWIISFDGRHYYQATVYEVI